TRPGTRAAGADDPTIVNPGKLSRARLEAVCSLCHLQGAAQVHVRGRKVNDFRPGMPLSDYRIDYVFDSGSEQMTVVGHVEQLRRSACYKKSGELSCLTCHDPHLSKPPKDPVAYYRQKCLDCHVSRNCSLERSKRLAKDPADNCVSCHMPRGDTELPHIAFTHHRIGRHPGPPGPVSDRVPELVPVEDAPQLTEVDRKRNLGLAYLRVASKASSPRNTVAFLGRARDLLEVVYEVGLRDGPAVAGLAEVVHWQNPDRASSLAREALTFKDLPLEWRLHALPVLPPIHLRQRPTAAAPSLPWELLP